MGRLVTEEWNADWEKDVEPNFVNLWKTEGEKKIIEVDNRSIGYFWFEQHPEEKEIFINSIQIAERFQRTGIGTEVISWLLKEASHHNLDCVRGIVQKNNDHASIFLEEMDLDSLREQKVGS